MRQLQDINQKETLPENALLVVIDAIGLYTNIPQEEGVLCVEEALEQRVNTKVPSKYIARLLEIILQYSVFEFNEKKYQQKVGTSMGTKPAPSYANIFLANKIDRQFWKIAEKYMENGQIPLKFMRRFLDDIFMIFIGTVRQLHLFFEELNQVHPTMKFTMTHTTPKLNQIRAPECDCPQIEAIPFLDTLCQIKEGKICTDLYRKPTDRNQYLLPSSCHNLKVTSSIPFSLGMRINRVCSETENRDLRLQEMKEMLLERDYTPGIIDAAISRTKAISRDQALKLVLRQPTQQRPTFVVSYDPRLPSIPSVTKKHWRSMVTQDKYLERVFPEPPLIAFKRQKNLRETLIRAKVAPPPTREKRKINGMKKCGKCIICSYVLEGNVIKSENFTWKINRKVFCTDSTLIYLIECQKETCRKRYVGFTTRQFRAECVNI